MEGVGQSVVPVVGMLFSVFPDRWESGPWVAGTGVCCFGLGLGGGATFGGVGEGVRQGGGIVVGAFDLCAKHQGGGTHLAVTEGGLVVGGAT